jgi:hypothetical protein
MALKGPRIVCLLDPPQSDRGPACSSLHSLLILALGEQKVIIQMQRLMDSILWGKRQYDSNFRQQALRLCLDPKSNR